MASSLLNELELKNPEPLRKMLDDYAYTLRDMLQVSGVELALSDLSDNQLRAN